MERENHERTVMGRMEVTLNQILDIRKDSLDILLHLKNDMNAKSRSEFVQRTQERMSVNVIFPAIWLM
jgi:hypothetical protein